MRGRFPQTRDLWKRESMGERVGRVSSYAVSSWTRSAGCCGFRGVFWVGRIFFPCFCFRFCLLRTLTACCKYEATLPHLPLYYYRGAYRVSLFNLSVCLSVCACVTFVVFTDCESCTRPISTNLGSMEAGECGRTRETCFTPRRLEVVAVAELLWIL